MLQKYKKEILISTGILFSGLGAYYLINKYNINKKLRLEQEEIDNFFARVMQNPDQSQVHTKLFTNLFKKRVIDSSKDIIKDMKARLEKSNPKLSKPLSQLVCNSITDQYKRLFFICENCQGVDHRSATSGQCQDCFIPSHHEGHKTYPVEFEKKQDFILSCSCGQKQGNAKVFTCKNHLGVDQNEYKEVIPKLIDPVLKQKYLSFLTYILKTILEKFNEVKKDQTPNKEKKCKGVRASFISVLEVIKNYASQDLIFSELAAQLLCQPIQLKNNENDEIESNSIVHFFLRINNLISEELHRDQKWASFLLENGFLNETTTRTIVESYLQNLQLLVDPRNYKFTQKTLDHFYQEVQTTELQNVPQVTIPFESLLLQKEIQDFCVENNYFLQPLKLMKKFICDDFAYEQWVEVQPTFVVLLFYFKTLIKSNKIEEYYDKQQEIILEMFKLIFEVAQGLELKSKKYTQEQAKDCHIDISTFLLLYGLAKEIYGILNQLLARFRKKFGAVTNFNQDLLEKISGNQILETILIKTHQHKHKEYTQLKCFYIPCSPLYKSFAQLFIASVDSQPSSANIIQFYLKILKNKGDYVKMILVLPFFDYYYNFIWLKQIADWARQSESYLLYWDQLQDQQCCAQARNLDSLIFLSQISLFANRIEEHWITEFKLCLSEATRFPAIIATVLFMFLNVLDNEIAYFNIMGGNWKSFITDKNQILKLEKRLKELKLKTLRYIMAYGEFLIPTHDNISLFFQQFFHKDFEFIDELNEIATFDNEGGQGVYKLKDRTQQFRNAFFSNYNTVQTNLRRLQDLFLVQPESVSKEVKLEEIDLFEQNEQQLDYIYEIRTLIFNNNKIVNFWSETLTKCNLEHVNMLVLVLRFLEIIFDVIERQNLSDSSKIKEFYAGLINNNELFKKMEDSLLKISENSYKLISKSYQRVLSLRNKHKQQ